MINIFSRNVIETLLRLSIPALLSLIAGMLNTYHNQSVLDRRELIKSVQASAIVNARQDQSIHYLTEIIQDIRQNNKKQKRP